MQLGHALVHLRRAASFWHNANESYKNGARLAHQNFHKVVISTYLLRWSCTGLSPKLVLRRTFIGGVVRRAGAVVLIVRLRRPNFFFRLTALTKTTVALALMVLTILALTMTGERRCGVGVGCGDPARAVYY